MKDFQKRIDEMVSKILKEEIEKKSEEMSEKLYGGQDFIAKQAKPKNKITSDDFRKLRSKKETKEEFEGSDFGDYEGDEGAEEEAEELSAQEPTYVGRGLESNKPSKMYGSFSDDHGWYDESDRKYSGDFGFGYDEYEFDEFDNLMDFMGKGKHNQKWFGPNDGKKYFDMYKEKMGGPFRVRTVKDIDESETEEGNAFTDKLRKTKKGEKFNLDGKTYTDTSNIDESKEKWIQKTDMKKGALRKKLGVPEGEKIPKSKLNSLKKELMKKSEGDKTLSAPDAKLLKQVNLALTLGGLKENKETLTLSETELIDLIESIVLEQKKLESPKDNIKKQTPIGLSSVEKANKKTGEVSDAHIKETGKKIADYMKTGSKEKFTTDPKHFPKGNGELAKMEKKTYQASKAVEDYVDNFTAAGLENLVYDEIHPNEEWVDKNIEGSSETGNNPEWANAVDTGVNKKRNQIRKDNLLGAVKQMAYNKAPQPTEESDAPSPAQKFDKNFGKNAGVKANKILNQLESTDDKKTKLISEEMDKMKKFMNYNQKTQ